MRGGGEIRGGTSGDVAGEIDDAVRSQTEDRDEFESTVIDSMANEILRVG